MKDALARAKTEEAAGAGGKSKLPVGWSSPKTRDEGQDIVFEMEAPGLDPDTLAVEPQGSKLHIRASGTNSDGSQTLALDESLNFPEGSELTGATANYGDDRLVVRIPKAGLKPTQTSG